MSCSPEAGIVDPGDPGCLFLLTRYGSGMSAGIGYPGTGDPEPAVRARNLWPGADRERACNAGRSEVLAAGSLRLLRLPGRFSHLCLSCRPGNCTCFVEHYVGGSSGSAVDAARRAGYPWPEKLAPQLV